MAMPPNFNRPPPNFAMPPVPRDAQEASFSEIIPLRSKKINLFKSPALWVTIAAGLISIAGFSLRMKFLVHSNNPQDEFEAFKVVAEVSTFALLLSITSGLYFYARPNKPYWFYLLASVLVGGALKVGLMDPLFALTADFSEKKQQTSIFYALLGPGVREEFFKAIPTLLCALLSFMAMRDPRMLQQGWVRRFRLTGPLDGVVMGIAAGAGFTFAETGFQYVSNQVIEITNLGGSQQLGEASGMALLVPRVIEGLTGHSGYSAIFGYFIGLAVIRPRSKWMLIGMGYGIAALLHGLWDGANPGVPTEVAYSALTGVCAVGVLLKARQLETIITGRAAETSGSIIVERPVPAMQGAPYAPGGYPAQTPGQPPYGMPPQQPYGAPLAQQPYGAPPPRPPFTPPPQPYAQPLRPPYGGPPQQQPQGFAPPPFQPAPGAAPPYPQPAPPAAPAAAAGPLALDLGGVKVPLAAGDLDLGAHSELGGKGAGVKGVVVPHPARPGVFGLRNTGATPWTATLRDGSTQVIEGEKNIRLAPGVRIDFGGGLTGAVVQG